MTFAFIFHIDCLVAVCQPLIKLLLTYLLTYLYCLKQQQRHATKRGTERSCGADQNDDNLRISRAYLRISDHCRVGVTVSIRVSLGLGLRIVVYRLLENVTKCGSVT